MIDLGAELAAALRAPSVREELKEVLREVVREELAAQGTKSEYLTLKEAARMVSVSAKTLRRWIDAGTLRRYGHGQLVRVRRCELEALLESDVVAPANVIDIRRMARELVGGGDE